MHRETLPRLLSTVMGCLFIVECLISGLSSFIILNSQNNIPSWTCVLTSKLRKIINNTIESNFQKTLAELIILLNVKSVTQKVSKDSSKDPLPKLFSVKKKAHIFSSKKFMKLTDRSHSVTMEEGTNLSLRLIINRINKPKFDSQTIVTDQLFTVRGIV